ncbi:hypothetical protein AQ616_18770 [Oceanobacillus sp. E9]|uniref:hypothetical protein n=1 Tax=Oceanobacillus sp. E9 TaxID=1742575 RepID=UPI00084EB840|nr:hypothetical protein [Oceanobacillus sp. E9]OEH52949.1 hypothetical protein AQ616_18770 [Oceanobacillus sp. E9]
MILTNFGSVRINDSENFVDIRNVENSHISIGVMLTAYDFASEIIEVRRKNHETTMFVLKYDDIEIPEYWKDAEIIFTNRK